MQESQVFTDATNQSDSDVDSREVKNEADDSDLLSSIVKNIKDSRTHFSDWRKDAREDYDFFAGRQWTADDIAILENQQRPAVTFNRTARTINSVAGLEVQNRQEIRYFPRQLNSSGISEILSGAAKWVRDECDAEDEESEQFQDCLITGMGWTETRLDYETDSQGAIIIDRCDPLEMGVDHTSKKRNCEDARFRYRLKTYSRQEFTDRFPDAEIPKSSFFDSEEDLKQVQDLSPGGYHPLPGDDQMPSTRKQIQVAQYQYFEIIKIRMVQDENGQMTEMPDDTFKQRKSVIDAKGWKYTQQPKPKRVYYQCFLTPEKILEKDKSPVNDFTFHCVTGLRDRNKNIWFGIVKMMKDPQRWANKWLSQIQHILNTQAKSGKLMYEVGAFKNAAKAREEWGNPALPAELNPGGLEKVEQIPPAQYPEGIDRLLQYALSAVNDVPGVNLELMGLANRDQANVLEQSRKQAGLTILAVFFDSLRRYRKKQGRVLAEFIQDYISDGRLVRISGPLGQQYVPLIRDPNLVEYDVVVDDTPTSTNMKERTFGVLQSMLPMILQEKIPIPPDLLDYTPLPEDLIQKWKQYIQAQAQDPMQQQAKQLGMAGQQADVQSKQADAQQKTSKAKLDEAHAMEIIHKIQNPEVSGNIDMQKAATDFKLRQDQMTQELQLKREELQANLALKRDDMLIKHHVASQDNEMRANAASKPTANVTIGSEESFSKLALTLSDAQKTSNEIILNALETISNAQNENTIKMAETIAKALTSPKEIVFKNNKPVGIKLAQ